MSTVTTVPRPNKPPEQFDQAKLDSMLEPFTVRVERIKGNTRSPIPMPMPPDGGPSGSGFDKVLVMGLEQWLINEWSGGGMLRIVVTDSDQPKPQQMAWQIVSTVPEKIPPTLASAGVSLPPSPGAVAAAQRIAYEPPQVPYMSSFPNGLPSGLPPAPQGWQQLPPGWQQLQQPQQQQQPWQQTWQQTNELAEMRQALARANETALKLQHENERARETAANNERLARLESSIAKLAEAMAANATSPHKNAEVEALREANKLVLEKLERSEREAAADRRDRDMKDAMREQAASTQRMVEAMQAQLAASLANKGADPIVSLMLEQTRMQAEVSKENAREQRAALDKVSAMVMGPEAMIRMVKDSQTGIDQVTGQVTRAFSDVIGVQSQVMRNMTEQQGGGGKGIVDVVDGAFDRFGAFAQQWAKGKAATEKAQHDAQASVAQAQAQAMTAQASVITAQQRAMSGQPQPPEPPPAVTQAQIPVVNPSASSGLGGARLHSVPPTPGTTNGASQVVNGQPGTPPAKRGGRTDEEWFGPLFGQVQELRVAVAQAVESLNMDPPRVDNAGRLVGATPDVVANAIVQASSGARAAGMPIPAMIDLLDQQRFADFLDLLLPDAPQQFRDAVIQMIAADAGGEDDDEDDEEDEAVS